MTASERDALRARLLVVAEDQQVRSYLASLLPGLAENLVVAWEAQDALDQLLSLAPEVVLVVHPLSGMDTVDFCRELRCRAADAQVMLLAATPEYAFLHRLILSGLDAYLDLPVDPPVLRSRLARCIVEQRKSLGLKLSALVFDAVSEGVIVTDENSRVLAVNPAFSALTGYRPDQIIGQRAAILASGVHNKDFYRMMWESLLAHGYWAGEIRNRRRDGSLYDQWLSISMVDGDSGEPRRFVGLLSDITERKREEERMRRLAHFDSLTSLPNRVLFNDRLQRSMARADRHQQKLAILYLDLDDFKRINDTLGHAAGDEVLRQTASRMLEALRITDTVSRRGGDEFVLIVEQADTTVNVAAVCNKLLESISISMAIQGQTLKLGASIGVAIYPDDAEDPDALLASADTALLEVKANGKGGFRFFNPAGAPWSNLRQDMEQALREGLDDWQYTLHYLPEVSLTTGQTESIEALLRFQHPEFGLLEAGRFLEIAEQIGIMPELGRRALAQAARELSEIDGDPGLVIDLSARQLSAPGALNHLLETLAASGVPNHRLTFECPESALTGNEKAVDTLLGLADSGCRFSLDDFGAGYCSFSLLSRLPMHSIKIDRSFTSEIVDNPAMRELVAALIAFAQRLGVRVVAEGVESEIQLRILRQLGCDAAQGYVFGEPRDIAALRSALREGLIPAGYAG